MSSNMEDFVHVPLPLPCMAPQWARLEYIKKSSMADEYCSEDDEVVEVVRGGVQPWVRLEYIENLQWKQKHSTATETVELAQGRTR